MSEELSRQLRRDEGTVSHAYTDSEGYLTIGVGRLIDKRKGGRLRPEEIEYLLQNDIKEVAQELASRLPWTQRLDSARLGVLQNMVFNMGIGKFLEFKKTLALVQSGDYLSASKEMLDSKWAKQVGPRAVRLSEQMASGVWQ